MIVPAAPIVPSDNNGGIFPICAATDRINNRSDPCRPRAVVTFGMIGSITVGDYPAHLCKVAIGNIGKYLSLGDDHVAFPDGAYAPEYAIDGLRLADVLNGIGRTPD